MALAEDKEGLRLKSGGPQAFGELCSGSLKLDGDCSSITLVKTAADTRVALVNK